jgi:D-serine deaminase-like pyridoxal phosphate-dependent protein
METNTYTLTDASAVNSPALLYYPDIICENIAKAIKIAGGAHRLWPHVKSHKLAQIVNMQQQAGIERFKCATIAEAEMLGAAGARHVMLAYPLVGPSVSRFVSLTQKFPACEWWAAGDNAEALKELDSQIQWVNETNKTRRLPNLLIDVNMGMDRTGVPPDELEDFYIKISGYKHVNLRGFHCYDGHINDSEPALRRTKADAAVNAVLKIRASLRERGYQPDTIILGGTPTFPCHAVREDVYLSPGTLFVNDYGYASRFTDLPFMPAAALLTRVVSHPAPGLFTLDAGTKAVGADMKGMRGIIFSHPHAASVAQSEEHWVFRLNENDSAFPAIGDVLYIIPTHICTTAALHEEVITVRNGIIDEVWHPAARTRKITL